MIIQESAEMYFESIMVITNRQGYCRAIDIARELGFSKPTISEMMKKLKANNYIEIDEKGHITLTESSREIAEKIYERHEMLTKIFIRLGVDPKIAEEDACRCEHYLSSETFDAIRNAYTNHK
ncbi:MAG: metal-dependent transcriptional regulator [Erysipelotrichaceae bacterium]|nr:metal-dependent transcriptional regulator [Erysipelotrichaceae bacterium]